MHVYLDKCSKLKINIYIICFCFENIYSPLSCLLLYKSFYHLYFAIELIHIHALCYEHCWVIFLKMSTYVCTICLCIYVKPMNSMVLDNKQYNTYSTIRVQNGLSLILLGYNKTIACNTRTFAWRTRSHTAHARI